MKYRNDTDFFCLDLLVSPVIWGVFCVPCVLVGLPASAWLLWVLKKQSNLSASGSGPGSANVYLLNLTIMDILFNLALIPTLVNHFSWRHIQVWLCGLYFYCVSLCGRPLFTACVCMDCYMAVVHPVFYMRLRGRAGTYRLVLSAVVWAVTLGYGYLMVSVTPVVTIVSLSVSAPVILFCNLVVLWALKKPDPSGKTEVHPQKKRALQVVLNSVVVTLVTYPPTLAASAVYGQAAPGMFCKVMLPFLIGPSVGSTVMPLLYLSNLGHGLKCTRGFGCVTRG